MPRYPNREDDLARPRHRKGKAHAYEVDKGSLGNVTVPQPNPEWSETTLMLWNAALESGVSEFYASTDWATLYLTLDGIEHWRQQGGRRSPELLRVLMQALGALMFTEGDRRKLRVELEKLEQPATWEQELDDMLSQLNDKAA